ncbi:MAG TPA: HlyD family efflux transporter periplasmic adaptor subunit [Vicinamibacterales bacterium]|nr:HlyD family efflux transporter periplasmic adaptor subunit [Vicinamibacterales bacterium]
MKRFLIWIGGLVVIGGIVGTLAMGSPVMPERRSSVPTAKVVRGPLKLTVYATGELRAGRTMNVTAPPAGGSLRIVKLVPTGIPVKKDDVVIEFDPADQIFAVEQAKSDLAEADQQIVKMKADTAVTASQDTLNLMTARFDVRRGELDTAGNEFIGAIDAQKNALTLEESRRHLQQLEQDASSRTATTTAALAVVEEKRNKAQLAMKRAQGIIESLIVKAPIDGVVSVKENSDGQFFFFTGMVLPQYREGDTTFSGRNIADVVENGKMEVRAKVTETDRDNLQAGQTATVQVDALPGRTFTAKVGALASGASRGSFFETSAVRQFDINLQLDKPDPQMRAGSSLRVVIDGREIKDALHVPRQAVFEKNGKNYVFLQIGDRFDRRDVKVVNRTEGRAVVTGINEGDAIALVDPDAATQRSKSSSGPLPSTAPAK